MTPVPVPKGKRILVKFGGNALSGEGDLDRFGQDIAALVAAGFVPVLVHGGGPEISQEMERRGLRVNKIAGLRVTDDASLVVAEEVLHRINSLVVDALVRAGVRARGMAGATNGLILAVKMPPVLVQDKDGTEVLADLGHVGNISQVDPMKLNEVLASGAIPVIYPICADEAGRKLNVNADTVAAHVARAAGAEELVLVSDVPGILRGGEGSREIVRSTTLTGDRRPHRFRRDHRRHGPQGRGGEDRPPQRRQGRLYVERKGAARHRPQIARRRGLRHKYNQGMKMNKDKVRELDQRFLFQNYARQDICFDHGEREFLYDLDGKRYIDLVAGIAVNSLGYAHPTITKAICEQAQRLIHVSNLYLIKEQAEAAEALASIAPPPLAATMFVNSGAEANEAALKLAVKATGRSRIVSTRNSFHGRTSMTLSATGQPKYQSGFEPLLSKAFDFIDYGSVEQLKTSITRDTAALICEPIQGEGGVIPAGDEFFRTARDICDERGALFIVDEVQTGMGRTGRWFGFQHHHVVPDIVTLAKALGNGFPVGACLTTREIASAFQPGMHGTTFGGNPLACAVVKAVIDTMKEERLVERSADLGASWAQDLRGLAIGSGKITDVRGRGLMIGLEMGDLARQFQEFALNQGILVNVSGGKVVRLVPPLIVSEMSVRELNGALKRFLDQLQGTP